MKDNEPIAVFRSGLSRADHCLLLYRRLLGARYKGKKLTVIFGHKDLINLLRIAWVICTSALDRYLHEKVSNSISPLLRRHQNGSGQAPPALMKVFKDRVTAGDMLKFMGKGQPMWHVRKALDGHFSERTFQSPDGIQEAVSLLGIDRFWERTSKSLKLQEKSIRDRLSSIYRRRNQIVHEGDLSKAKKYRNQERDLKPGKVRSGIRFIGRFVEAANRVIDKSV